MARRQQPSEPCLAIVTKQRFLQSNNIAWNVSFAGLLCYWAITNALGMIAELGDHRLSKNVHTGDQKT
jgi:hypothetical protein